MAISPAIATTRIQIDASAHCQLACPLCPTASGATRPAMGAGHLDPRKFEALLDANPALLEVELSNYGEMFLNPRLLEILRIAHERGVTLHADNGVNMNHAADEVLEAMARWRFRSLNVSIDGATPATYARYRVRGDFERVVGNIRKLNEYKQRYSTAFPLLSWQFIVFGHNEHEILQAKNIAAGLGMAFRPKISWDEDFSPVQNPELVRIQTGLAATRQEHYRQTGKSYLRSICHQLWHAPVLNWDGRITGCCRNFWGDFGGNAFEQPLEQSLDSPRLQQARLMLMGRAAASPDVPCTTCEQYITLKRDRNWITEKELQAMGPTLAAVGIIIEAGQGAGQSQATHADVFLAPGGLNPALLERPPAARRHRVGDLQTVAGALEPGKEYTIYVLPKRIDPALRIHYPPMPPVTRTIEVARRPLVQEFTVSI